MNSVPSTSDVDEWIDWLKEALQLLLSDVDRVSVGVAFSYGSNIDVAADPDLRLSIMEYADDNGRDIREGRSMKLVRSETKPADHFVAELKERGYPIDRHQPPYCIDYYDGDEVHLGSIVLWRDIGNPPLSEETKEVMERLRPFLTYIFSNYLLQVRLARPAGDMVSQAIYDMIRQTGLSAQEQKIIWLRIYGHSYKEIASILSISVTTVKKHLNTIHRKTGTRSLTEILAKDLAPSFPAAPGSGGTL
jgi:DNA-binding CsgD family transcriptional regulator